jgi:hypothetical protein
MSDEEQPLSELSDEEFTELLQQHDVWQRDRTYDIALEMVRRGLINREGKPTHDR